MQYLILSFIVLVSSCTTNKTAPTIKDNVATQQEQGKYKTAILASGCFWCVEGIFETIEGVEDVVSGFSGGDPSITDYKTISKGKTDHAEVVKITYDPSVIDYQCLLRIFFESHDPTTLNRQGPDVGRQYRSAIFYSTEEEKNIAESYIQELTDTKVYDQPITTTLEPFEVFIPAADYHQDFKRTNKNNPYVINVSVPRLEKFKAKHKGCK